MSDLKLNAEDEVLLESLVLAASDNVVSAPASDRDQFAPERRRAFVETSGDENVYLGTGDTWVDVSENTGLVSALLGSDSLNTDSVTTDSASVTNQVDAGSVNTDSVTTDSASVTNQVDAGSVNTGSVINGGLYVGNYNGSDADERLTNALSDANAGDRLYLESATYTENQTFSKRLEIIGLYAGSSGTAVDADWTLDEFNINFSGVTVLSSGSISVTKGTSYVSKVLLSGSISVDSNSVVIYGIDGGSVTFTASADDCIIDASSGVSVTDNGANTVGDIA